MCCVDRECGCGEGDSGCAVCGCCRICAREHVDNQELGAILGPSPPPPLAALAPHDHPPGMITFNLLIRGRTPATCPHPPRALPPPIIHTYCVLCSLNTCHMPRFWFRYDYPLPGAERAMKYCSLCAHYHFKIATSLSFTENSFYFLKLLPIIYSLHQYPQVLL